MPEHRRPKKNTVSLILEKDGKRETFSFKTSPGGLKQAERRIRRYILNKWLLVDCKGSDQAIVKDPRLYQHAAAGDYLNGKA